MFGSEGRARTSIPCLTGYVSLTGRSLTIRVPRNWWVARESNSVREIKSLLCSLYISGPRTFFRKFIFKHSDNIEFVHPAPYGARLRPLARCDLHLRVFKYTNFTNRVIATIFILVAARSLYFSWERDLVSHSTYCK